MAKKDFHKLIEEQNDEEKELFWSRLEERLGEEHKAPVQKRKKPFRLWRVLSACASVAVCLAIGLGLGLGLNTNGGDDIAGNVPPNPTEPEDPEEPEEPANRYCGFDDCETKSVPYTLKQFAQNYELDLLYLDWYDEAEDYGNSLYTLIETGEAVCFQEFFADVDWNYVNIYVTDNRTETDFLKWYDAETGVESNVNQISVYYKQNLGLSNLNFEYKGYRYYLVSETEDADYILRIAESMLSKAE